MDSHFRKRIAPVPDIQLSAAATARPGVEIYHVAKEDEIEMALLEELRRRVDS
jgi:hypothetical protein